MKKKKFDPFDVDYVMKMNKPLSDRDKLFCKEYLRDMSSVGAVVRCGYPKKGGYDRARALLLQPNIMEYINKQRNKMFDAIDVNIDFVLRGYKEIALKSTNNRVRLSAYDSLAKHLGMFDKYIADEVSKPTSVTVNIVKDVVGD